MCALPERGRFCPQGCKHCSEIQKITQTLNFRFLFRCQPAPHQRAPRAAGGWWVRGAAIPLLMHPPPAELSASPAVRVGGLSTEL